MRNRLTLASNSNKRAIRFHFKNVFMKFKEVLQSCFKSKNSDKNYHLVLLPETLFLQGYSNTHNSGCVSLVGYFQVVHFLWRYIDMAWCKFGSNSWFISYFFHSVIHSDKGLTLETSVFESFTVANLPYQPCG